MTADDLVKLNAEAQTTVALLQLIAQHAAEAAAALDKLAEAQSRVIRAL